MIRRDGVKTIITLPKLGATPVVPVVDSAAVTQPWVPPPEQPQADAAALTDTASDAPVPVTKARQASTPKAAAARAATTHGVFAPVLLAVLTLLGSMGWQTWLLYSDRQALHSAHTQQQPAVVNAAKLRGSLDTLAADTQRLADGGNASARLLVEELKKRGVTINAGGPAPK